MAAQCIASLWYNLFHQHKNYWYTVCTHIHHVTLHYMYIINLHCISSIIVNSICFLLNISENFPNIYKEKNLNGLRYLLQKKYSEVSFERLFLCEILQSAATKISNAVQGKACSSMYMDGWYNTRISCHVLENKQHLFFSCRLRCSSDRNFHQQLILEACSWIMDP